MVTNLHGWLRRAPLPAKLKLDTGIIIEIGDGRRKWQDAISAVEAAECSAVTALDRDGHVLRVAQLSTDGAGEVDTDQRKKETTTKMEPRDVQLARLLIEAGDRAAARHETAYAVAFDRYGALVDVLSRRLVGLETQFQKMLNAAATPEPAESTDGIMQTLIQSALAQGANKSNGKKE